MNIFGKLMAIAIIGLFFGAGAVPIAIGLNNDAMIRITSDAVYVGGTGEKSFVTYDLTYDHQSLEYTKNSYESEETERWALMFDINPYPGLISCYKETLLTHGWESDNIRMIYSSSYSDVQSGFSWLIDSADENDIVLIVSNNHGGNGFIVLDHGIPLYYSVINQWLDNCKAQGILYSISACMSGSAIPILGKEGRVIITACKANESGSTAFINTFLFCGYDFAKDLGYDGAPDPNGAFAREECDLDNNGWVSAEEAFIYAKEWTEKFHNEFWNIDYPIHPQIYDGYGGDLDITFFREIDNNPPHKPSRPSGENEGKVGSHYVYTTSTIDPDGNEVYYRWDFGDGIYSSWMGPYPSEVTCEVQYSWDEEDDYEIRVKAKDEYGAESGWSDPFPVTMPKRNRYNPMMQSFLQLLERFPFLHSLFSFIDV